MGIPESTKKMHKLFRELLNSYSIEATDITYTNFRSSITSFKGRILMWTFFYFYPLVPFTLIKKIKSLFFGGHSRLRSDNIAKKSILQQFENVEELKTYFNVKEILPYLSNISSTNLYNLFTITSSFELFLNKKTVIEDNYENEFN